MKSLTDLCYNKLASEISQLPPYLLEQLHFNYRKIITKQIKKELKEDYEKKIKKMVVDEICETLSEDIPNILSNMITGNIHNSYNETDPLNLSNSIDNKVMYELSMNISRKIMDSITPYIIQPELGDYNLSIYNSNDLREMYDYGDY